MTITELRKLIRQSEDKTWYKSIVLNLNYEIANFEIELTGLDVIYQFFVKQRDFFVKNHPLPEILEPSRNHFKNCVSRLEAFINKTLINGYRKESEWRDAKKFCQRDNYNREVFFNKESEVTDFLLKLDSEFSGASRGAYDFFTNNNFEYNNSDKNYFIGWHRAYEFFTQDADFVRRRKNERYTLSRIRSEYVKKIEDTDAQVSEHIADKEEFYTQKEEAISRLIRKKNNQYETWKSSSQKSFSKFLDSSDKAFKDLEKLYKDNLMLSKPAEHWDTRATELKSEAKRWLIGLICSIVISVALLVFVLILISNGTLADLFSKTGSAIRWSIVFITLISFLAFAIRTFNKLSFSAYHLARDAEERKQLVYVYLALKQDKAVGESERMLILQSIFSRADSGLLKEDSSPTMPTSNIIDKIIKNN